MTSPHNNNLNYLWFCLVAAFWGGSFVAIKIVIDIFPPIFSAMLRVGLSLFCLYLFFKLSGKNLSIPKQIRWKVWLAGLFSQGIPFSFLFWGEHSIAPGLAGVINGTAPMWTFLISLLVFPETRRLSVKKLIGLLLGITGMTIIFVPVLNFHETSQEIYGVLAIIIMAIAYAIGAILNQRLFTRGEKINFQANLIHQHGASLVYLLLASLIFEKWPTVPQLFSLPALAAVAYLGIFSTALAWIMYYHLIREWDAVRASAITYIVPVMALFWDYFLLHNKPGVYAIVGCFTVISAVIIIQYADRKRIYTSK